MKSFKASSWITYGLLASVSSISLAYAGPDSIQTTNQQVYSSPSTLVTPLRAATENADVRATGQTINSATLNAAVTVALNNGEGVIGWTVSGLAASGATLTAEASNDGGATWVVVNMVQPGSGALSSTQTADGQFRVNGGGHTHVRLRVSTVGTGTITVAYSASSVASMQTLSTPLPTGTNIIGSVNLSPSLTVPSSVLTRPANTTAYAGSSATSQLIGSSTTAGSVVVPSFSIATPGGTATIPRITLSTNATTGWNNVSVSVTLWTAAPTYSTGDGGTYTVATGAALRRSVYSCTLTQYGDGASCSATPAVGTTPLLKPASGAAIYWDVSLASAATPISGQTFTLIPEVWN